MGNQRVKDLIVECLRENTKAPTSKVIDYINEKTKWGATTNQVSNILSKHPLVEKVDFIDTTKSNGVRERQCVWKLKS